MLLSQRQNLIRRGLLQTGADLYPATVTFVGFEAYPIECTRRAHQQAAAARFGGLTVGAPVVLLIDKAKLPAGLKLEAQVSQFTITGDSTRYRVEGLDHYNEASEPQVRIDANNAAR